MHCQNRVWRIAPFTKVPTKKRKGSGPAIPVTPTDHTPANGMDVLSAEMEKKEKST
jgi:hypothetical protein